MQAGKVLCVRGNWKKQPMAPKWDRIVWEKNFKIHKDLFLWAFVDGSGAKHESGRWERDKIWYEIPYTTDLCVRHGIVTNAQWICSIVLVVDLWRGIVFFSQVCSCCPIENTTENLSCGVWSISEDYGVLKCFYMSHLSAQRECAQSPNCRVFAFWEKCSLS